MSAEDESGVGVLVVEDDLDNARLMTHWLRRAGLPVRHAITGEAALAECGRLLPQVLVLDLNLPGIDGLEVLRRLRAAPAWAGLPVVVTSIGTADDHRHDDPGRLVHAWLTKPFSSQQLLRAVRGALPADRAAHRPTARPRPAQDQGQGLP